MIWTQPEPFDFDPENPRKGLGESGFLCAFCDGSGQFIPASVSDETLRRLFARSDGQLIEE